jgi:zinc transport system substrate-binding protein
MKKHLGSPKVWLRIGVVAIALIVVFIVIDLYGKSDLQSSRTRVAATIFPVYDLVRSIGGDKIDVQLLLPEGDGPEVLPSLYKGVDLSKTQVVFAVGLGYDTEGIPSEDASKITTLDRGIDILLEQGSTGSPYYWLSVKNAEQMARTITERLSSLDPQSTAYFEGRRNVLLQQLDAADRQIGLLLSQLPKKKMVVYGYDWGYFAQEYGLNVVAYEPAGPLSDDQIEGLRKAANDNGVTAIFSDIRLSPTAFLPLMNQQYLSVYHLDIYGGVEDHKSYDLTMAYNAKTLYEGLTGAP